MGLSPACDVCNGIEQLDRIEVRFGSDPRPILSVTLCVSCRSPFVIYVERMQGKILEGIR